MVNDGWNTKFWEHKWIGDSSLQIEFPRLFLPSVQKECFASYITGWGRLCGGMEFEFQKNLICMGIRTVGTDKPKA